MFLSQPLSERLPRGRHALAEDNRVGAREVDVLEHTGGRARKGKTVGDKPLSRQVHDLARLHVPFEPGSDQVKGARLRRSDRRALPHAEREGPDAVRVPRREDSLPR